MSFLDSNMEPWETGVWENTVFEISRNQSVTTNPEIYFDFENYLIIKVIFQQNHLPT